MSKSKIFIIIVLILAVAVFVFAYLGSLNPRVPESSRSSSEEQKIMQGLEPNATEEEQKEYFILAESLAQRKESLAIKDCKGNPVVFKTTLGKTVMVVNQDSKDHQITLESGKYKYKVAANSTAEIQFDFLKGKRFYSYGCDRVSGPAGIFFVTE